jgi:hypothetical protein
MAQIERSRQNPVINPGEAKTIALFVDRDYVSYFDEKTNRFMLENIEYLAHTGSGAGA